MRRIDYSYLIGQKYGEWTIEDICTKEESPTCRKAKCLCSCGTRKNVNIVTLLNGESRSCGCQRSIKVSRAQVEDLTGQQFWFLTVLGLDHVAKNRQCMWRCKCVCGQEIVAYASNLKRGHTRSCGCIRMSKPEMEIKQCLIDNDIPHDYEFHFENFKGPGGGVLEFDFALFDNDKNVIALIEYQGRQHYKEFDQNGPMKNFGKFQREVSDPLKKKYCEINHIPLFEIRYDQDPHCETLNIIQNLNIHHANPVPSTHTM